MKFLEHVRHSTGSEFRSLPVETIRPGDVLPGWIVAASWPYFVCGLEQDDETGELSRFVIFRVVSK